MARALDYVAGMMHWNLNFQLAVPQTDEKWGFGVIRDDWSARPAYSALARWPNRDVGRFVVQRRRYCRLRDKQVHAQLLRQEPGDELALHAVASPIQRRRKRAQPGFAGRDGHDSAADAAFTWQTNLIEPVTGGFVQTCRAHHCERVVAQDGVHYALAGDRVDTTVGEGCAHDGQIARADVQRALPGVEIGRFDGIGIHAIQTLQHLGDAPIAEIGIRG